MSDLLIYSFFIALVGYTYSIVLTAPGMILNSFYIFAQSKLGHKEKLFNVLIDCPKCVSGQWALWIYLFIGDYNFIVHILFIITTIWFSMIINKIYTWLS
jgi:hypothetical protein